MRQASTILTVLCLGGLMSVAVIRSGPPVSTGGDGETGPVSAEAVETGRVAEHSNAARVDRPLMAAGFHAPRAEPRPAHTPGPSICNDPRLVGRALGSLKDEHDERCGAEAPVEISSVAGVRLEPALVTECGLALALANWLEKDLADHASTHLDAGLVRLDQVSGYVCRNRNNAAKGKLSEHALANAIDIARFHFADGRSATVKADWSVDGPAQAFLKQAWASACNRFGTVLGPDADEWHLDHFHLDGAKRRNAYCR